MSRLFCSAAMVTVILPLRLATAALVFAIGAAPTAAQGRDARAPQTDQSVPVTRGARLAISNFAGEVVIHTWDKDSLRVQARHSSRARVNIRNTSSGVSVSASATSGPPGTVDYDVTAPGWMPVKIDGTYNYVMVDGAENEVSAETVRGDIVVKGGSGFVTAKSVQGEIIVEGARGKINLSSVNEGIKITGASGDIVAETTNGSISMSRIDAKSVDVGTVNGDIQYEGIAADGGRYRFVTHNGDITVAVPETSNATFSVRTYNGDFHPTLPVKGSGDTRRGKRAIYTLGNGSADVEMESFGGTIRLRRAGSITTPKIREK